MTAVDDRPVYTLKTPPAVPLSYDEAIERARALKPRLRERVPDAERLRRLPPETVADLLANGLYGLMTPKRFGGSELGSEAMIDVTIELASACPSTGWVHMLWTAHMWLLALFPRAAQEELWSNPNTLASSVVNTVGDVVPVAGGYRWTGRGFFSSGVDHCNWLTAAAAIKREGLDGPGERRWLLIPREDFEIIDDWYTVGLKGTGSKTIVVNEAFIPEERTLPNTALEDGRAPGRQINCHPMYGAISAANFTAAMAAPAVGAARGFLHAFEERLRLKSNNVDDGLLLNMSRYAQAAAQVDAVHALTLQNAQRLRCAPALEVTADARAKCRRDQAFSAQTCRKTVNMLYEECGGSGLFESSDFQRLWRDTNAAAAHHGLTWDWHSAAWTKTILGLPTVPGFTFSRA
ncbi:MAG TPA: acyl-CoA dehydrogenase family protein [Chloroflexota bacterium]|nr:acyl-CoA dehydrogenase family protein [Chloroflexota bacterium]